MKESGKPWLTERVWYQTRCRQGGAYSGAGSFCLCDLDQGNVSVLKARICKMEKSGDNGAYRPGLL